MGTESGRNTAMTKGQGTRGWVAAAAKGCSPSHFGAGMRTAGGCTDSGPGGAQHAWHGRHEQAAGDGWPRWPRKWHMVCWTPRQGHFGPAMSRRRVRQQGKHLVGVALGAKHSSPGDACRQARAQAVCTAASDADSASVIIFSTNCIRHRRMLSSE